MPRSRYGKSDISKEMAHWCTQITTSQKIGNCWDLSRHIFDGKQGVSFCRVNLHLASTKQFMIIQDPSTRRKLPKILLLGVKFSDSKYTWREHGSHWRTIATLENGLLFHRAASSLSSSHIMKLTWPLRLSNFLLLSPHNHSSNHQIRLFFYAKTEFKRYGERRQHGVLFFKVTNDCHLSFPAPGARWEWICLMSRFDQLRIFE